MGEIKVTLLIHNGKMDFLFPLEIFTYRIQICRTRKCFKTYKGAKVKEKL